MLINDLCDRKIEGHFKIRKRFICSSAETEGLTLFDLQSAILLRV
jgi:hypothetical protein